MARAAFFVLAVVCMMGFAMALDHTHVNNALPVGIIASTVYSGSGFTNRNIPAGGSAVDQYNHKSNGLDVKITVPAPSGGQTTSCQGHIGSDVTVTVKANSASGHAEVRDISNNALVCTCN
ncbi:TPA: hypothetical protein ACH3X1_004268 [Trebouxia sp. C0004]